MPEALTTLFEHSRSDYTEVRLERRTSTNIVFRGKELEDIGESFSEGAMVRVLNHGLWGMATVTGSAGLRECLHKANQASALQEEGSTALAPVPPVCDQVKPRLDADPRNISLEAKLELTAAYNNEMLAHPRIQSTNCVYRENIVQKLFANSEGTHIEQEQVEVSFYAAAVAREGDNIQTASETQASQSGYKFMHNLQPLVRDCAERAELLLQAQPAERGEFPVVVDPRLTGVFVHEAFGHLSEADHVYANENLKAIMQLGRTFGPEALNIVDDGTRLNLPGGFKYDDEGVPAGRQYLIRQGNLCGRLHSRETAAALNEAPTGNARAVNFNFEPLVRMRCTYIEPGDWKLDDMIQSIAKGYLVCRSKGGQTNLDMFTFAAQDSYRIEQGEITGMVRDINLCGNLFDTLKHITAVGDTLELFSGGSCGKGEQSGLPVSMGGPCLKIQSVVVG